MSRMNKRDFMRREFIGLEVEVVSSPNRIYEHVKGKVVDESKNTLIISSNETEWIVPKSPNEFLFTYEGKKFMINGSEIQHRPEDRIKKIR